MAEATVGAIVQDSAGERLLLVRRATDPYRGAWCLPGGHVDPNETASAAIRREVEEEAGLVIEPRFWTTFDEIIPERGIHAVVSFYDGRAAGHPQPRAGDISEARWFAVAEAAAMPLAFRHNSIVEAHRKRREEMEDGHRQAKLAEYKALRDESLARMGARNLAQLSALTAGGTFITMSGAITGFPPGLLLLFPLFTWFLALFWAKNDLRIGEIGRFIRKEVEAPAGGLGWEAHLRDQALLAYYQSRLPARWTELAAVGLFVVPQGLLLIVGVWRIAEEWTSFPAARLGASGLLMLLGVGMTAWSAAICRSRGNQYRRIDARLEAINETSSLELLTEAAKKDARAEVREAAARKLREKRQEGD